MRFGMFGTGRVIGFALCGIACLGLIRPAHAQEKGDVHDMLYRLATQIVEWEMSTEPRWHRNLEHLPAGAFEKLKQWRSHTRFSNMFDHGYCVADMDGGHDCFVEAYPISYVSDVPQSEGKLSFVLKFDRKGALVGFVVQTDDSDLNRENIKPRVVKLKSDDGADNGHVGVAPLVQGKTVFRYGRFRFQPSALDTETLTMKGATPFDVGGILSPDELSSK